jgi:hypothetical protein
MPNAVPQSTFDSVAKELLANAATLLAAERRSYAAIEAAWIGTGTDAYANFLGVADALDALADDLRA